MSKTVIVSAEHLAIGLCVRVPMREIIGLDGILQMVEYEIDCTALGYRPPSRHQPSRGADVVDRTSHNDKPITAPSEDRFGVDPFAMTGGVRA